MRFTPIDLRISRERERERPEPVISPEASVFILIVGVLPDHAQGKTSPGL